MKDLIERLKARITDLEKQVMMDTVRFREMQDVGYTLESENAALKARICQLEKSMEYSDSRGDHS